MQDRSRLGKTELVFFGILFFLLAAIFGLNGIAQSSITSPQHLAIDLASPPDTPQDWGVDHWVPTKYRALYRWIVQGTFGLLFAPTDAFGFYLTFIAWGYIFFCCTLVALYYYLRVLEFGAHAAFIGCLLFLASPPVALAYKYPVFTREDSLAYFLVLLGLIALFKQTPVWISTISVFAALTHETTLILPLVYLLATNATWRNRMLVCVPPIAATFGVRVLLGWASYNPFEGSIYNFETPWQSVAFIFCIFGALWLPFLLRLREGNQTSYGWRVLTQTGLVVLVLSLGTHIVLARAREIRISFLIFPWVIPFALDWFRANRVRLKLLVAQRTYWGFTFAIFATVSLAILFMHLTNAELMRQYLADFKNGYWLGIADLHLTATLAIFLPLAWQARKAKTQLAQ